MAAPGGGFGKANKQNLNEKREEMRKLRLATTVLLTPVAASAGKATVATVNNPDMVEMQKLSAEFTKANPVIAVKFVVLPDNMLEIYFTGIRVRAPAALKCAGEGGRESFQRVHQLEALQQASPVTPKRPHAVAGLRIENQERY